MSQLGNSLTDELLFNMEDRVPFFSVTRPRHHNISVRIENQQFTFYKIYFEEEEGDDDDCFI